MKEIEIVNLDSGEVLLEFKTQAELIKLVFDLIEGKKKFFCDQNGVKYTIRKKYSKPIGKGFYRTNPPKKKSKIVTGIKKKSNPLIDKDCLKYEN